MAIAFVNSAQASGDGGDTTIALPATSLTAGNLLVVAVRGSTSQTVSSISDTAGNTFVQAVAKTDSGAANEIWYAKNTLGNGSNIVTVTYTGSVTFRRAIIAQYSGLDLTSPLDTTASGGANGPNVVTSGTFSTAQADEVIVAHANVDALQSSWTEDTGYTEREQTSSAVTALEDEIVSSIQSSVTTSYTAGDSAVKSIVVATFKATTAGSGGVSNVRRR